jgi:hypothetical protein
MVDEQPARVFAFDSVEAYITPEEETIVDWKVNPRFEFRSDTLRFYVEIARAAGEWERLNPNDPVTDACLYLDRTRYRCGYEDDIFYRVVAHDGECEYTSRPAHTLGQLSKRDWLLVRDILRKEYLRLRKYTGTLGWLLRRREYGQKCSRCADFDSEEIVNSSCPLCYGTGFVRGFYNGIPFYMDFDTASSNRDVKEPFGMEDNAGRSARCIAFPRIATYDLWVHGSSYQRYVIRAYKVGAEIRGVPLIYAPVAVHLLPATDISYKVPIDQRTEGSSSAECAADPQEGWRRGISVEEVW